jgi:hypothetical protein
VITVAARPTGAYWVVTVTDEPSVDDNHRGRYSRRFVFEGEDAGVMAAACWASATLNGFKATSEHVQGKTRIKEELADA